MARVNEHGTNIVAVIVSYFPERGRLDDLVHALSSQVDEIVIVDNGSSGIDQFVDAHVLRLGRNVGVAAAQNVGIGWAKARGARFVILFDQDSWPESNMVERLLSAYERLVAEGRPVAAVGPRYGDACQEGLASPFVVSEGNRLVRIMPSSPHDIVDVDFLISSGCMIPLSVINAVGLMKDELFIDYVDIEWGLRARRLGFRSFGVFDAHMRHCIGEGPINFFGRKVPAHSPLRRYYNFRNAVWLFRQPWLWSSWKVILGRRMILQFGFYSLFARPRWQQCKMMSLGFWHGIRGRMGALKG